MTPINHPLSPLMSRPRITASDRLEADKAKYVKSPQVIHRRQNPAIGPLLSPVLSRKQSPSLYSASSPTESSSTEYDFTNHFSSAKQGLIPQQNDFNNCLHRAPEKSGPQSPVQTFKPVTVFSQSNNLSPCLGKNENHNETYKDNTLSPSRKQTMSHNFLTSNQGNNPQPPPNCSTISPLCRKRLSGRRLHRPDSLIMYRQKRDDALGSKENDNVEAGLVIRFLQGTPLLRRSARFSQNQPQACTGNVPLSPKLQKSRDEPVVCQTTCTNASDTQEVTDNDSLTFGDAQKFFESCGLQGSLLNLLEMYQKGEDHTSFGSMESMDRVSGGIGAVEEEKAERTPVSVIERNARVIKWIYSCQRARTDGSHEQKQTPRESTV
ncbi:protein FAM110D [Pyxicephalus adspersus]|uniref:protein FAM110D n=1 Tax=Pyxicephalus adspersus TaxID=30357 RepID=UPI003B5966C1